jgi:hypothetical protein
MFSFGNESNELLVSMHILRKENTIYLDILQCLSKNPWTMATYTNYLINNLHMKNKKLSD